MKNLVLPEIVESVRIYGDNGDPGHRFAEQAAEVFYYQGRVVKLIFPEKPYGDFNDVLQGRERAT